jgi:ADP-ribose pyrophosphatase YjhB (NUDIX family)
VKSKTPATKRWARLGPNDAKWLNHVPEAGVCISVFIIARKGKSALVGRPRGGNAWAEKGGFPAWRAKGLEKERAWLLPATHLLMEEPPDIAARRIAHQWAGLTGTPRFLEFQSHTRPALFESRKRGAKHWDLCFIYELKTHNLPRIKPWWSEMKFATPYEIRRMKMGRGHKDILREAGFI